MVEDYEFRNVEKIKLLKGKQKIVFDVEIEPEVNFSSKKRKVYRIHTTKVDDNEYKVTTQPSEVDMINPEELEDIASEHNFDISIIS